MESDRELGWNYLHDRTKYSNNLWFGAGSAPPWDTSPVNRNPILVAVGGTYDLHLRASSPAIGHGVVVASPSYDFDGTLRPSSERWDIGAYQASSAPATSRVNIKGGEHDFAGKATAALGQFLLAAPTLAEGASRSAARGLTSATREPTAPPTFERPLGDSGHDLGHNRARSD